MGPAVRCGQAPRWPLLAQSGFIPAHVPVVIRGTWARLEGLSGCSEQSQQGFTNSRLETGTLVVSVSLSS